jgi:hypothetical protein
MGGQFPEYKQEIACGQFSDIMENRVVFEYAL